MCIGGCCAISHSYIARENQSGKSDNFIFLLPKQSSSQSFFFFFFFTPIFHEGKLFTVFLFLSKGNLNFPTMVDLVGLESAIRELNSEGKFTDTDAQIFIEILHSVLLKEFKNVYIMLCLSACIFFEFFLEFEQSRSFRKSNR